MNNNTLTNVHIKLKHDTIENWTIHDPQLVKGEYAAAVFEDGSVKIKVGDGYSKFNDLRFVNDNTIAVSQADAGDFTYSQLSVWKLSEDKYAELIDAGNIISNCIYITSADVESAHGLRITDVAEPIDLSDAVTKNYVDCMAAYPIVNYSSELADRAINTVESGSYSIVVPESTTNLKIKTAVDSAVNITFENSAAIQYGDSFPTIGANLIDVTKIGNNEYYVRTVVLTRAT